MYAFLRKEQEVTTNRWLQTTAFERVVSSLVITTGGMTNKSTATLKGGSL